MAIGELHVSVKADIADIRNALNTIRKEQDKLKEATEQALSTQNTMFGRMQSNLEKVGVAIGATFIVDKVKNFGKAILGLSGNLEQNRIAFTTMLGSAEKANDLLKELSDFAKRTPFELTGLREQAKQLLAFDFSAEEIIPTLESLGNIASVAGLDKLPRLTYALGQVKAAGTLLGQDFRQFTETGLNLGDALAKIIGYNGSITSGNVAELGITYDQVAQAIKSVTSEGGQFAGLMQAQSKSLLGSVSNLQDGLNSLGETIGNTFSPFATKVVQLISDLVGYIQVWAKENPLLATTISVIAGALGAVVIVGGSLLAILPFLISGVASLGTVFGVTGLTIGALLTPIGLIIAGLTALGVTVTLLSKLYKSNFGGMKDEVDKWVYNFKVGYEVVKIIFSKVSKALGDMVKSMGGRWNIGAKAFDKFMNIMTLGLYGLLSDYVKIEGGTKGFIDRLVESFNKLGGINKIGSIVMKMLVNQITGGLSNIISIVRTGLSKISELTGGKINLLAPIDKVIKEAKDIVNKSISSTTTNTGVTSTGNNDTGGGTGGGGGGGGGKGGGSKKKEEEDKKAKEEERKQEELHQLALKKITTDTEKASTLEKLKWRREFITKNEQDEEQRIIKLGDIARQEQQIAEDTALEKTLYALETRRINKEISDEEFTKLRDKASAESKASKDSLDGIYEASQAIKEYNDKIGETIKKFGDLRNQATEDIRQINQSLGELDQKKDQDISNRYVQILNQIDAINKQGSVSTEDSQKRNELDQERQLILNSIGQEVLNQAVAYDKLSETQKIIQKAEEDRAVLLEKQSIAQALQRQQLPTDGTSEIKNNITIDPETNKVFYENEKGALVEITDVKNQEYARDLVNKQVALQQELAEEQKILLQKQFDYSMFVAQKQTLESNFTKFMKSQVDLQRSYVDDLIKKYNEAAAARARAGAGAGGTSLPGRETGGPVTAGQPYIVGEKRPEVFVPNQSGMIIPSIPDYVGSAMAQANDAINRVMKVQMEKQAQMVQNISQDKSITLNGGIHTGDVDGFRKWMDELRWRLK